MTSIVLHPFCDNQIFRTVIAPDPAGHTMLFNGVLEEVKDSLRAIVVVHAEAGDHVRLAINKAVHHNFEPDESYGRVRVLAMI